MELDDELQSEPDGIRCPSCFRRDIVPSMPRGFFDRLMIRWGRIPRHCRACGKRFRVRASLIPQEEQGRK